MGKTYIISLCALILAVACTQDDAADKEIRIDGNKATFIGDRVKGDIFDIIFSKEDDSMTRSYLTQVQTGISSPSHLEFDSYLMGVNVSLASDHYPVYTELTFRKKASVVGMNEF